MKLKAIYSFETLAATYKALECHNPEDRSWHIHRHEMLRPRCVSWSTEQLCLPSPEDGGSMFYRNVGLQKIAP
jgi:hypothetical protein